MKLRLTLALLLGLSLACGSDDAETPPTPPPAGNTETTTPPPPPPPPPPPENTNTPPDGTAEGTAVDAPEGAEEGVEEEVVDETTEEEADEDQYESKSFTVSINADRRSQMRPNAEAELSRKSRAAGYGDIRTVKLTAISCSDAQGCSAQTSGKAYRKVEKEEEEGTEDNK
ncbi:MAG: colicin import membrane protein [Myxococcota bacterium]|jgi:colicin import membrane protein